MYECVFTRTHARPTVLLQIPDFKSRLFAYLQLQNSCQQYKFLTCEASEVTAQEYSVCKVANETTEYEYSDGSTSEYYEETEIEGIFVSFLLYLLEKNLNY